MLVLQQIHGLLSDITGRRNILQHLSGVRKDVGGMRCAFRMHKVLERGERMMSLMSAIVLMRKIRDSNLSLSDLSPDEKAIFECLLQGGFVYISEDERLRLTTHGAEIVALNDALEELERKENLDDIAKDLIAEIASLVNDGDYGGALFHLFELFWVLDALLWRHGRLIL